MKTKYLDNEIELLNAIKRNEELSDYGKEKLIEFNEIKKALTIPVVVGTYCDCDKYHDRYEEVNNNCNSCDKPID
tara:strand:+ start:52 stop:276 length:225 start_codon:yes stop_codon:yes gene_type:complete